MTYLDLFYPLDDLGCQDKSKEPTILEQPQVENHGASFVITVL